MTAFELYPSIDLRDGHCVRLYQGDYAQETVYDDDPVRVARSFADAGATWIHVVDLDAARTGRAANLGVIEAICAAVPCAVQSGGGVRSVEAAGALLHAGVRRVVVGTAAIERPALVEELCLLHPRQVAVGLDARGVDVAVRGLGGGDRRRPVRDRRHASTTSASLRSSSRRSVATARSRGPTSTSSPACSRPRPCR